MTVRADDSIAPFRRRPRPWRLLSCVLLVCMLQVLAAPAPAAEPEAPAYQADLLRFSELVGALTYLDQLCGGVGETWRIGMARLLAAQNLTGNTRRPYVEAYNRGQRTLSAIHRSCTAQSAALRDRYLSEGADLADRLAARYGGDPSAAISTLRPRLPAN